MRECEYYQELMSRLLDGDLTGQEEQELRQHVRACPDCQRMGAALTGLTDALREEELVQPPPELAQNVMDRVMALDAPPSRGRRGRERTGGPSRQRRMGPWVRLAAAACLVLIVGGVATFSLRSARQRAGDGEAAELAAEQRATEAAPAPAAEADTQPAEAGGAPMAISEPAPAAADAALGAAMDTAPAAEDGAMAVPAAESPSPSPIQQPLPVYDAARTRIGTIAVENIPAFLRLITDAGWGTDGPPAETPTYLMKVQYMNRTYDFATDGEGGLVWWEEPSTDPLRSPGTYQDLHDLIATEAPALPE